MRAAAALPDLLAMRRAVIRRMHDNGAIERAAAVAGVDGGYRAELTVLDFESTAARLTGPHT